MTEDNLSIISEGESRFNLTPEDSPTKDMLVDL